MSSDPSAVTHLSERFEQGVWNDVTVEAGEGEARATVRGTEAAVDLPESLLGSTVHVAVGANAWGQGHSLTVAVDELTVGPRDA